MTNRGLPVTPVTVSVPRRPLWMPPPSPRTLPRVNATPVVRVRLPVGPTSAIRNSPSPSPSSEALVTVAGPIISTGVVITGSAFDAPPWAAVMRYVQPPVRTRVSDAGVELARLTAATKAFALHATGMVMACATGGRATRPPPRR
ncbi:hypothetical protein [Saccharothrix yanglingensis]|uniref:hypothetical protein n=1 Tax=Saccharothrix yanglingensis TaxID=659496 RepID=UPI0027D2ACD3|nr:hypothetical protein [Saccharothrix yanglingensis]